MYDDTYFTENSYLSKKDMSMFNFIKRISNRVVFYFKAAVFHLLATMASISTVMNGLTISAFYLKVLFYFVSFGIGAKPRIVLYTLAAIHAWVHNRVRLASQQG